MRMGDSTMKIVCFTNGQSKEWGILDGVKIRFIDGDIYGSYRVTEQTVDLDDVQLLAPCAPSKGVCIGLNYHDHAQEMQLTLPEEPLFFLKPSTSLNHPSGQVEYPAISHNLHYEAELAIVIKKKARHVSEADAHDYILGYTCANDVTARDIQMKDGQWTRGKSFDTFMPLGPCIETELDPHNLHIRLYLNGELKQSSNTRNLIFSVPRLIAHVSQVMTLLPGDVILTGTPAGVGAMQVGDQVMVEIEGIGRLVNTIVQPRR